MNFFHKKNKNDEDFIFKSISTYARFIESKDDNLIDGITDLIISVVNAIHDDYFIYGNLDEDDAFDSFCRLVTLFSKGKIEDLHRRYYYREDIDNLISYVYSNIFNYLGIETRLDLIEEWDNNLEFKIRKEFDSYFVNPYKSRTEIYGGVVRNFQPKFCRKPDIKIYNNSFGSYIPGSCFDITNSFKGDEASSNLYCTSKITFNCLDNIGLTTRSLSVEIYCQLKQIHRFDYSIEDNFELNKWILRKLSFFKFMEVVDFVESDPYFGLGNNPNYSYIKTYWLDIYRGIRRNKIRLG